MAFLRVFEEIDAWRQARELSRRIYRCSARGQFARDMALQGQLRRAAVSIMSNIAEGFERGGPVEFARFLTIAKGSAGEVQSQLYVALDAGYIDEAEFEDLQKLAGITKRQLAGFIHYLRRLPAKPRATRTKPIPKPTNQ